MEATELLNKYHHMVFELEYLRSTQILVTEEHVIEQLKSEISPGFDYFSHSLIWKFI